MPDLNLDAVVDDALNAEARKRSALAMLLDDVLRQEGRLLVGRSQMGGTESYVGTVNLSWVGANLRLASSLPLLKNKIDDDGRLVVDAESIELFTQREIDWSRQSELAHYLVTHPVHKFPPLLVVITASWVDEQESDAWGADGKAVRSVAGFESLDNRREVGLLDISQAFTLYALDGQHRKIGIDGALTLVSSGRLQVLKEDGNPVKDDALVLGDLIDEFELNPSQVQKLGAERIGIEFIPAVVAGETREEARRRVRSVFTHVNKQAAPLTGGQIAQLDEDSGFAIVARQVSVSHELLRKKSGRQDRVNFKNATIALKSASFTTLQTVKEMAQRYLGAMPEYQAWKSKGRLLPMRPSPEQLDAGRQELAGLMSAMEELPNVSRIQRGTATGELRRFAHEQPPGEGHMLFRPIGQIALAQACGAMRVAGLELPAVFAKLNELDAAGGFRLDTPENPWYGVLYDPAGQRMRVRGRDTAARVLVYLVTGLETEEARAALTEELRESRRLGEEDQYRDYDGSIVSRDKIKLPPML
ncbi:DGQHR domain-containing protein [Blastococcus sp. SYSU DS0828]